jgi:hypothetical protein
MLRQRDAAKREGRKCREVLTLLFCRLFAYGKTVTWRCCYANKTRVGVLGGMGA